ncbi:MAG TPA: pitrilysin family protein, partial [Salinivirgaceae bacterium]|nr:pitrilysin family protein [Salinivirgaceae bacterium]
QYFNRGIELFSDIIFNSTFPEQEIIKERNVVIEEIKMYKDTPSEHIFDMYDELLFPNHPIGRNILGTEKSLRSFTYSSIKSFWNRALDPSRIVVCSAGKTSVEKIIDWVQANLEKEFPQGARCERQKPIPGEPFSILKKRNTHQNHCILGVDAYPAFDSRSMALRILNSYLGGNSMNSRLNILLRERHGLVYQIESFYNGYSDIGSWGVYFGCDHQNTDRCLSLVREELHKVAENSFSNKKLSEIKRQLIGQMILDSENTQNIIFSKGKTLLLQNKIYTIGELLEMIQQVTPNDVLKVAQDLFSKDRLSTLILR